MALSLTSVVVIGRQDYLARSVHFPTDTETWNATFSKLSHLNPCNVERGGLLRRFADSSYGDEEAALPEAAEDVRGGLCRVCS